MSVCHATVRRLFNRSQLKTQTVMIMKCPTDFHSKPDTYFVQAWCFVSRLLPVIAVVFATAKILYLTHYRSSEIWFQYYVSKIKLCYHWSCIASCLGTLVFSSNCKYFICLFFSFPSLPLHLFRFMKTIWHPKYTERSYAEIYSSPSCSVGYWHKRKRPDKLKL